LRRKRFEKKVTGIGSTKAGKERAYLVLLVEVLSGGRGGQEGQEQQRPRHAGCCELWCTMCRSGSKRLSLYSSLLSHLSFLLISRHIRTRREHTHKRSISLSPIHIHRDIPSACILLSDILAAVATLSTEKCARGWENWENSVEFLHSLCAFCTSDHNFSPLLTFDCSLSY
jgi:hypothetical protein